MTTLMIVAEKPSVARAIVKALSIGLQVKFKRQRKKAKYNVIFKGIYKDEKKDSMGKKEETTDKYEKITEFKIKNQIYPLHDGDEIIITSVLGHILNFDYPPPYNKETSWEKVDPEEIIDVEPIEIPISQEIILQLQSLAENVDHLVIATDFDAHGESIGGEIARVCQKVNNNIIVSRMYFTATNPASIIRAFKEQETLDELLIAQIDTLRKQDLKMGAIITRYLTVGTQKRGFPARMLSYGPCQTSVLFLIAKRYFEKMRFVPEKLWTIQLKVPNSPNLIFKWVDGPKKDENLVKTLFNKLKDANVAHVSDIEKSQEIIPRPLPLDTDTLESELSLYLRVQPKKISDLAEKLYNNGFITYPRTESSFYHEKDLTPLVSEFLNHPNFHEYAEDCLKNGNPKNPRKGRFTKDHEPIKPVKAATRDEVRATIKGSAQDRNLAWRIYEYVVRRFLATVHRDIIYEKVKTQVTVHDQVFFMESQQIVDPGFMFYYPYFKLMEIPHPQVDIGSPLRIVPEVVFEYTQPPPMWTSAKLIRKMAEINIGTDATRSTHLETLIKREYALLRENMIYFPTPLGQVLYNVLTTYAYELIDPSIRSKVEGWTLEIKEGKKTPQEVDSLVSELTKRSLQELKQNEDKIFTQIVEQLKSMLVNLDFGDCPICGNKLTYIYNSATGTRSVRCENTHEPHWFNLPKNNEIMTLTSKCQLCGMTPIMVGTGTKSWYMCPFCWTTRSTPEKAFFCSVCTHDSCEYVGLPLKPKDPNKYIMRGILGTCNRCHQGDVLLEFRGTLTRARCNHCNTIWKTPNIRVGTSIQLDEKCRLCGLRTLQIKRNKSRPFNLCVICERLCFECEYQCFS